MKELRYQLHSIFDKNFSIVRGWTFAKFFLKSKKNVKCQCNDIKKNLSVLWERKSKCPKKNFQSVERRKRCKCRISGVRKKKELKEKFRRKKIKVFLGESLKWKILLSSCLLVGLYVNLQDKVAEKFDENFQSIFRVGFWS